MIRIVIGKQTYVLRWDGKQWKDKAGHVWVQFGEMFKNPAHGIAASWNCIGNKPF